MNHLTGIRSWRSIAREWHTPGWSTQAPTLLRSFRNPSRSLSPIKRCINPCQVGLIYLRIRRDVPAEPRRVVAREERVGADDRRQHIEFRMTHSLGLVMMCHGFDD